MYTYNPTERAKVTLPVDGIYFVEDYSKRQTFLPYAFFFNRDGSLTTLETHEISKVPERKFWQYPDEFLKSMNPSSPREAGHYRIDSANIIIEVLTYYNGIIGYKSIRFRGRMENDSTIILNKCFCHWCASKWDWFPENGNVTFSDQRYRFYRPSSPDTEKAWFRNARWYRKNVWYNRDKDK